MKKIKVHKLGTKENPAKRENIDNLKNEIEKGYFECGCGELVPNGTTDDPRIRLETPDQKGRRLNDERDDMCNQEETSPLTWDLEKKPLFSRISQLEEGLKEALDDIQAIKQKIKSSGK